MQNQQIAVIGGGVSGLSTALRLAKDGAAVTLYEASPQLGGLGTFFRHGDGWLDRFYHCVMPTDAHLRGVIDEVGLRSSLYWRPTTMGFVYESKHYAFNSPLDLLRFSPLSPVDRVRLGATTLLLRHLSDGSDLDDRTTADWLSSLFGRRIWQRFWRPLFRAKFGDKADALPARYIWQRLGREGNTADRGYLRGGLRALIGALEGEITGAGGRVICDAPVETLEPVGGIDGPVRVKARGRRASTYDWVVSTVPLPQLAKMAGGTALEPHIPLPDLPYQGVVNALFFLRRGLDGHYWTPVVASGTEFDGVVEMTTLVDREQTGGAHLAYVMHYADRSEALFAEPEADIAARWRQQLVRLYASRGLRDEHVAEVRVFRAPFVEPAYPLGYGRMKPGFWAGPSRVVLATTAQIYPDITAWNFSIRLGERSLTELYSRAGCPAPKSFAQAA